MGDGRGQRIGGIGLRDAAGGQQPLDHELHLVLAGMARAHHDFLMWLGEYSAISSPACAAASSATARAWPSLSAAEGSLATKACSTAMAWGDSRAITR